jgi:AmiR/NasT family two-component response regulator
VKHDRHAYQRAVLAGLWCPTLSEEARDELARAQGLLMRRTGYDLDDARAALLRAATLIPSPWSEQIMAEVIVEQGRK